MGGLFGGNDPSPPPPPPPPPKREDPSVQAAARNERAMTRRLAGASSLNVTKGKNLGNEEVNTQTLGGF